MIENTDQLEQAIEQMGRMQRILDSYRVDILPKNPRNFAVFAEGSWTKSESWRAKSRIISVDWGMLTQFDLKIRKRVSICAGNPVPPSQSSCNKWGSKMLLKNEGDRASQSGLGF